MRKGVEHSINHPQKITKMTWPLGRIEPKLKNTQNFCRRVHYPPSHHLTFIEEEWKLDKSKNTFSIETHFAFPPLKRDFSKIGRICLARRKILYKMASKKFEKVMPSKNPSLVRADKYER